jgi:hypothetical protein
MLVVQEKAPQGDGHGQPGANLCPACFFQGRGDVSQIPLPANNIQGLAMSLVQVLESNGGADGDLALSNFPADAFRDALWCEGF